MRMKKLLLTLATLFFISNNAFSFVFSNFETPESVLCDPEDGSYYVSNVNGDPGQKDANGYISKVDVTGNTVIQKFIGNKKGGLILNAPKGMALSGMNIFVADIDTVKGFNKQSAKASVLVDLSGLRAKFLNDLAIDEDGMIYVSDTATNRIFKIDPKKHYEASVYIEDPELEGPNGLMINPKNKNLMVVSTNSGQLIEIDREGGLHTVKRGFTGLDGIDYDSGGNIYLASFDKGEIYKITNYGRGSITTYLSGLNAPADISINRKKRELLVPLFKGNTVSTHDLAT